MKYKKRVAIVIVVLIALITGCDKKNNTDTSNSSHILEEIQDDRLEEYDMEYKSELPPVTELVLIDNTCSLTDSEMKSYESQIISLFTDFCQTIFSFRKDDKAYKNNLLNFFTNSEKYPDMNYSFVDNVYSSFLTKNIAPEFVGVTMADITFNSRDKERLTAQTKGVITARFKYNSNETKVYNTVFRANFLYDREWYVTNMELWQVYEGDVSLRWNNSYETLQVEGDWIFSWSITD